MVDNSICRLQDRSANSVAKQGTAKGRNDNEAVIAGFEPPMMGFEI